MAEERADPGAAPGPGSSSKPPRQEYHLRHLRRKAAHAPNPLTPAEHLRRFLRAQARTPGEGSLLATLGRFLAAYRRWSAYRGDAPHAAEDVLAELGQLWASPDGPFLPEVGIWPDALGEPR